MVIKDLESPVIIDDFYNVDQVNAFNSQFSQFFGTSKRKSEVDALLTQIEQYNNSVPTDSKIKIIGTTNERDLKKSSGYYTVTGIEYDNGVIKTIKIEANNPN